MKKVKKHVKKAVSAPVVNAKRKARRPRQSNVGKRLVEILSAGPIGQSELMAKGKFTPSALYLHLKKLKSTGGVTSTKVGRGVVLTLTTKKLKAEPSDLIEGELLNGALMVASTSAKQLATRGLSSELRAALDAIANRLSPIDGVEEKLIVLDRLARVMPPNIGAVLHAVMQDLVKISSE